MKKMAIIGTGIAGMSAAYFLKDDYEITVLEKNNYIGGHTNTIEVFDGEKECPMDTGFMVFNEKTYPNLVQLFKKLNVSYVDTDMSFSVRNDLINLEFNGSSLNGLFSQRKNILNLKFLNMIREILIFNKDAINMLNDPKSESLTVAQYLDKLNLSKYFFDNFLAPMSSAVWSSSIDKIYDFPAKSLVRFFHNHGFVGINTQLQWKTVQGGSKEYRNRLISTFTDKIFSNKEVVQVEQMQNGVQVTYQNGSEFFDKVLIATHADDAYKILKNPTTFQSEVLSKFSYQKNTAVVHSDESVMPKLKQNWSSWNFLMKDSNFYTVYYMNRLQNISNRKNFFVNINGEEFISQEKIIKTIVYHHPLFNQDAIKAQAKIDELNTTSDLYFTGSYYRYGFHEDALLSSVNLCSKILGRNVL